MAAGSCFCGNIRVEHNGQPLKSALCHCLDCRKITGSLYTVNYLVKSEELNVSGSPKNVVKTSDSGKSYKNYFCPDCGTPLFGHMVKPNGDPNEVTVIRAGIFDDLQIMEERKPELEIYTDRRPQWLNAIEGAGQVNGMLPT